MPCLTITLFNDESDDVFVIAKQCLNGVFSLSDDQFPASGTDSLHYDDLKTADCRVSKWPPAVQNGIFRFTGIRKWPPYGGSSLDAEVFSPLECIERFSMHFDGLFTFA